jgi:hypothetical protein
MFKFESQTSHFDHEAVGTRNKFSLFRQGHATGAAPHQRTLAALMRSEQRRFATLLEIDQEKEALTCDRPRHRRRPHQRRMRRW